MKVVRRDKKLFIVMGADEDQCLYCGGKIRLWRREYRCSECLIKVGEKECIDERERLYYSEHPIYKDLY